MEQAEETGSRSSWQRLVIAVIPLTAFLGLAAVFYTMLSGDRDPSELPSAILDQPAPKLELPALVGLQAETGQSVPGISISQFNEKISVVNVFASWCVPCREEHSQIMALSKDDRLQLIGINYKDKKENALQFLDRLGNPYDAVGVDRNGRAAIEWGVYGIPETFFVGKNGNVFHKHVGPISKAVLEQELLPMLEEKY